MQSLDQQYLRKQKQCNKSMGTDDTFACSDISSIIDDYLTATGNLISKLKTANLIVTVKGYRKGQYYSTESHK